MTQGAAAEAFLGATRTTAGAGVLVLRNDKLLMVRQARATGMRWEIPAGGQEPGETLEMAAAREAKEETGLTVEPQNLVCTYSSYRIDQGSMVLGAFYRATLTDPDAVAVPQRDDGIVAAEFIDPFVLPEGDISRLTYRLLEQWWPHRESVLPPFHLTLTRTTNGYQN
ncbi:MAG: NUDIX hydrolase [Corynebacteriales bacterium]|nr:NUDIX hydrolase [Mycobacteriales bacterium]